MKQTDVSEVRTASTTSTMNKPRAKNLREISKSVEQGRILAGSMGKGVTSTICNLEGQINLCIILGSCSVTKVEKH
jgi:hypothetical protein